MNEKILVVEKDPAFRSALSAALGRRGASVVSAADAPEALRVCDSFAPDAAVVGLGPADPGSASLCAILKKRFHGMRLCLLAENTPGDESGASRTDGLLSREIPAVQIAESVLRGAAQIVPEEREKPETSIVCGPLRLDLIGPRLYRNDVPVEMTRQELSLLRVLMEHAGTALSRSKLLELAWGSDYYTQKTVDVHIRRLRRKIEEGPSHPCLIQSIWGFGYRMCRP